MPAAWPSSGLPLYFLEDGYAEQWADNTIETQPDVGTPIVRPRSTSAPWFFQARMLMTSAQVETMRTFFNSTLASGSLSFTMTQPRLNTSVTARFVAPPTLEATGPDKYIVAMSFMVLP
jgi:hypothetical protein